jgi:hypothetical protein
MKADDSPKEDLVIHDSTTLTAPHDSFSPHPSTADGSTSTTSCTVKLTFNAPTKSATSNNVKPAI